MLRHGQLTKGGTTIWGLVWGCQLLEGRSSMLRDVTLGFVRQQILWNDVSARLVSAT
jgi:hypothetical protein